MDTDIDIDMLDVTPLSHIIQKIGEVVRTLQTIETDKTSAELYRCKWILRDITVDIVELYGKINRASYRDKLRESLVKFENEHEHEHEHEKKNESEDKDKQ